MTNPLAELTGSGEQDQENPLAELTAPKKRGALNEPEETDLLPVAVRGLEQGIQGLALPVTAPVDAINEGLGMVSPELRSDKPFMGSESIQDSVRAFTSLFGLEGREAEVGNFFENLLQIGASTVGPSGALLSAGKLKNAPTPLKDAANSPKSFAVSEGLGVTGASAGRTILEQAYPESQYAGFVGELLGFPAINTVKVGIPAVRNVGESVMANFGEDGSKAKVSRMLQENVEDPSRVADSIDPNNPIPGPKETGDPGLLNMARSQAIQDPGFAQESDRIATQSLKQNLERNISGETSDADFTEFNKQQVRANRQDIEQRIEDAGKEAVEALEEIPVSNKAEASVVVRNQIEQAYEDARKVETQKWGEVDQSVRVKEGVPNTQAKMEELLDMAKKSREIPADVVGLVKRELFQGGFMDSKKPAQVRDDLTVENLQNIRSNLLEKARQARSGANPDRNRAALIEQMADAVLDDMMNVKGASDELRAAIDYSRQLNNNFTRGPIGDLRGVTSNYSMRTDPEMTLSRLTTKAEKGGVNMKALLRADSSPATQRAVQEYLGNDFLAYAAKDNNLDVSKAKQWMRQNKEMLDQFPAFRERLIVAIEKGNIRNLKIKRAKIDEDTLNKSAAATFLEIDDPTRAIDQIRRSKSPSTALKELVDVADRDPTGRAKEGLKTLIYEDILRNIENKRDLGDGVKELSRSKAETVLSPSYKKALKESGLYEEDQIEAIDKFLAGVNSIFRDQDMKVRGTSGTSQDLINQNTGIARIARLGALKLYGMLPEGVRPAGGGQLAAASAVSSAADNAVKKAGIDKVQERLKRTLLGTSKQDKEDLKFLLKEIPKDRGAKRKWVVSFNNYLLSSPERKED